MLQADGGTRCAAISGAYVAARRALDRFGLSKALPGSVAAVSVGIVDGAPLLDLDYSEDSSAEIDMNVVMTGDGRLVEVQATAEREPFSRELLDELLDLAAGGIEAIAGRAGRGAIAAGACLTSRPAEALLRLLVAARARRRGRARARAARARGRPAHAPARLARRLRLHARLGVRLGGLDVLAAASASSVDPTRIAAQIVTGIGFLGAGAIIGAGSPCAA